MGKFFSSNEWIVKFTNLTITPFDSELITQDGVNYLLSPNAELNVLHKVMLDTLTALKEHFPQELEGAKLSLPCGSFSTESFGVTSLGIFYLSLYKRMGMPYVLWCQENGVLKNPNCPEIIKTATTYGMPISHYFSNLLIESVLQRSLGCYAPLLAAFQEAKGRASGDLYRTRYLKSIELLYMLLELYINSNPSDSIRMIKELSLNPYDNKILTIGWDVRGNHSSLVSLCCGSRLVCQVSISSPSKRMSYRTFMSNFAKGAVYIHSNLKEEISHT